MLVRGATGVLAVSARWLRGWRYALRFAAAMGVLWVLWTGGIESSLQGTVALVSVYVLFTTT